MATKTRAELDEYFEDGDKPTPTQMGNLIDSVPNIVDDKLLLGESLTVTAFAGGGQGSATALTTRANIISVCASNNDSVKLPAGEPGQLVFVYNNSGGGNSADVFPTSGGLIINAGVVDTALAVPDTTATIFHCVKINTWWAN